MKTVWLAAGALALTPALATAQQDDPYAICAAMADNAGRLACFDATYANLITVRADRAAADDARARLEEERREEEFGLNVFQRRDARVDEAVAQGETRAEAERQVAQEEAEDEVAILATVVEVFEDGARRQVVLLDNGQMWRETSNSNMRRRVRAGWQATIEDSFSGGYRMTFEGQSGFMGVSRVR